MKKTLIIVLASLLLCLSACSTPTISDQTTSAKSQETSIITTDVENTKVESSFVFTYDNYPRMGGSLANLPLGEAVTATVLGITRDEADALIAFAGSTTDNYKAIIDGDFDILLAYEPSEEAKQYITDSGKELEMTPIGTDALVFICNKENPVNSLTLDQIKGIYSGKIKNWSEVGGRRADILPYQRNKDSGSQTLFDKLIHLGDDLMDPPADLMIDSMIGLLEAVAQYDGSENALGYTVYYYLTNMEDDKLDSSKILALDGVQPSNETIGNGEYGLTNDFYVVIRKDAAEESPERILYNWICSAQGKELVEKENYVSK